MRGEEYAGWQAGNRSASRMQERGIDCRMRAIGTRGGAHAEHVIQKCDAGRVEAQWLVERRRALQRERRGRP